MKTKYLVRFLNKVAHLEADIEMMDIISKANSKGKLSTQRTAIFDGVDSINHPRLAPHKTNSNSRSQTISHLGATVRGAFIKDLYEEVMLYMTELVTGAAKRGLSPDRLIGEHKMSIEVNEILRCGNWNSVLWLCSTELFRKMDSEKKTIKALKDVNQKLDLGVTQSYTNSSY